MDKKSLKKRNLAELDLVLEEIIQRNPDWVDQVEKIVKECKMNELIKQLEKQCWSHRVDGVLIDGHLHFDTKKFAELIVKECIDIAYKEGDNVAYLARHFGV